MYFKYSANTKEYQHELRYEQELNTKSPPKRIRRWGHVAMSKISSEIIRQECTNFPNRLTESNYKQE